MLNNKIKYIALFIILLLSMNAFSATNFTDDSSETTLQSSSSDKVAADADNAADDGNGDSAGDSAGADNSNNANTGDNKSGKTSFGGNGTGFSFGNTSFGGNGSGFSFGNTSFGNGSSFNFNRSGSNSSSFDFASILDYVKKMMGGDNETNVTNETTNPEVSDVPRVVTSTSYSPVSKSHTIWGQSSHVIQRLRDNKTVSEGNALTLDGLNKLHDSDFTNGHLLVYVDGKLVFNEITAGDLSTPIFQITNDYIGQHQITVEFTANGNSNTNKYTEDVLII